MTFLLAAAAPAGAEDVARFGRGESIRSPALAVSAQPAAPVEVAHLGLGSSFGAIVAGPDGGAWVSIDRSSLAFATGRPGLWDDAIAHASADNRFRQATVKGPLLIAPGAVGPDGQAWFPAIQTLYRSDAAGTVTQTELSEPAGLAAAKGPDGTLWSLGGFLPDPRLVRIDAQGTVTRSPITLPGCGRPSYPAEMVAAVDGAVWTVDWACHRAVRIAPDGAVATVALAKQDIPANLAADPAGGIWFSLAREPAEVGHVDVAGTVKRWPLPAGRHVTDIAVGPDGAAHLALGRCALGRIAPDGALSFGAAPIPAGELAFDPQGGLWLGSLKRLVHAPPPPLARGACDDRPPAVRLSPGLRRTISFASLRRGVRISVREPAVISASGDYGHDDHDEHLKIVRARRGGTLLFRLPKAALRALERRRKPAISLSVEVSDRDGNTRRVDREAISVTR